MRYVALMLQFIYIKKLVVERNMENMKYFFLTKVIWINILQQLADIQMILSSKLLFFHYFFHIPLYTPHQIAITMPTVVERGDVEVPITTEL